MSSSTTMPARRAAAVVPAQDLAALSSMLIEHRRARADQIEAILWLTANGAADAVDTRQLDAARAALADAEAALDRLAEHARTVGEGR